MPMWYSILQANCIRKEYEQKMNIQYDIVMRYRTDCILEENLFIKCKESIASKKEFLCIPKSSRVLCEFEDTFCDWIAFGTPSMMDIYCSVYEDWTGVDADKFPIPEKMLFQKLHDIALERPSIDFYLIEGDGSTRGILLTSMS
jgi:mevalonate kinase